jgi:hypothetical protein
VDVILSCDHYWCALVLRCSKLEAEQQLEYRVLGRRTTVVRAYHSAVRPQPLRSIWSESPFQCLLSKLLQRTSLHREFRRRRRRKLLQRTSLHREFRRRRPRRPPRGGSQRARWTSGGLEFRVQGLGFSFKGLRNGLHSSFRPLRIRSAKIVERLVADFPFK